MKIGKYVYTKLFLFEKRIESHKYMSNPLYGQMGGSYNNNDMQNKVEFITVAFNNVNVIDYQFRLLKKFCEDEFTYSVFDNSTNETLSKNICEYCGRNDISYYRLPQNPFNIKWASYCHGLALNYIFYNYILQRKAIYVAILDHDIFPIQKFSVKQYCSLGGGIYGHIRQYEFRSRNPLYANEKELVYFWPGLLFVNTDCIRQKKINFMPRFQGDTGSGNYLSIYKDFLKDKDRSIYFKEELVDCWKSDDVWRQNSKYQIYGETWLHMMGASKWMPLPDWDRKEKIIYEILNGLLKED